MSDKVQVGCLRFEAKDGYVEARLYEGIESSGKSILLGTIHLAAVVDNKEREDQFINLIKGILTEDIEQAVDGRVQWLEEGATEHKSVH